MRREMVRAPVLAAGGIVLRCGETPLIAVVRLRERTEWVLPKGKPSDGHTARGAALREVAEATAGAPAANPETRNRDRATTRRNRRRNLVQRMRDWLRRAA